MVPEVSLLEDSSNSRRETWSEKCNVIIGDNPASETESVFVESINNQW